MKKILIIEDDVSIRGALRDILNWQGYDYREAKNGIEGVEIAKTYLPDLIICDVTMPQLDGYGVLQALQAHNDATATIPFVFLTAKSSREEVRYGMSMGADDYILKPFTAKDVLDAVSRRLEKFEKLQEQNEKRLDEVRSYINMTLPHELRTPLTGILGYLDLLSTNYTEMSQNEMGEMLGRLHESALRLQHTVENYLLFTQLALALKDKRISQLLREEGLCFDTNEWLFVASQLVAKKRGRLNDLQVKADNAPLAVSCELLKKLMQEVVDNALKFSEAGQPVHLTGEIVNGRYKITVQDYGRGMRDEQIQKLETNRQFDRNYFEQQGTGLGLTIAKQITQLFLGEITITSEYNVGTTVIVWLALTDPNNYVVEKSK